MGYFGKLEEKEHAIRLRRKGLSYTEILQKIPVARDTISHWCRDISLTDGQKLRLINKQKFGQKKGSIIAAENKKRERERRTFKIWSEAKVEMGKITSRDEFIAGVMLYSAEGDKTDGKGGFANSDPTIIRFMTRWFKKYLKIPRSKLRGAIWLHEGLSETKAKNFWSDLTEIPISQFYKTYIAKIKSDSKKIRKNIHKYGVFSINFSDSDKQRRLMGWISAFLNGKIKNRETFRSSSVVEQIPVVRQLPRVIGVEKSG